MNLNGKKEILCFADVKNARVLDSTAEEIHKSLDKFVSRGYTDFSPGNIRSAFFGNMAAMEQHQDSDYGFRMQIVKSVIEIALYSNEGFVDYLKEVSEKAEKEAVDYELRYQERLNSLRYKIKKLVTKKEERVKEERWEKNHVDRKIKLKRVDSKVCKEMAAVITSMDEEFGHLNMQTNIELLIEKAESTHIFSGIGNKTGKNLTFTDRGIRYYGSEIQQFIERIYKAGVDKDEPIPLTEEELLGIHDLS